MAEIIKMPRLSDTMTEGTVAAWLKKVGDKIEEGDILAEIETDKATMEFEAFYSGTLLHIGIQEGETAPVDSVLAVVGEEGEDVSELLDGSSEKTSDNKEDNSKEEKEDSKEEKEVVDGDEEVDGDKDNMDELEDESEDHSESDAIPDDVEIIKMPRLSDTMTEGTVAAWLKKVGDKVEEGDIIAEIETDKATMEFESFYSGTLLHIGIQEGETAPVDSVLAIIGPEGTDVSGMQSGKSSKPKDKKESPKKEEEKSSESSKKEETSKEDKETAVNDGSRIFASPLAKKIAEDKGIDLSEVSGSGENGRITKSDVENFKSSEKPKAKEEKAAAASEVVSKSAPALESEEVKNSQMRKTIARRLAESKFTAPHYYLTIEIDMDQAIASRGVINTLPNTKVSFNDMVVKACAMALKKHPRVNSQWKEEVTIVHKQVNIGVAVAVEDGLVVPVVPNADLLSLTQIGAEVKGLAAKARDKKLQPKEMEGSTFTVSNLGMYGISEFTSIINQPNSAILSVGAIIEKPVVKNGQIVVGNTMTVTMACDHRTVDGATGAEFLQTLRYFIENPVTMLA